MGGCHAGLPLAGAMAALCLVMEQHQDEMAALYACDALGSLAVGGKRITERAVMRGLRGVSHLMQQASGELAVHEQGLWTVDRLVRQLRRRYWISQPALDTVRLVIWTMREHELHAPLEALGASVLGQVIPMCSFGAEQMVGMVNRRLVGVMCRLSSAEDLALDFLGVLEHCSPEFLDPKQTFEVLRMILSCRQLPARRRSRTARRRAKHRGHM